MYDASVMDFPWNSSSLDFQPDVWFSTTLRCPNGQVRMVPRKKVVGMWSKWSIIPFVNFIPFFLNFIPWCFKFHEFRNVVKYHPLHPESFFSEDTPHLTKMVLRRIFIQSMGNLDRSTSWCSDAFSFKNMNSFSFFSIHGRFKLIIISDQRPKSQFRQDWIGNGRSNISGLSMGAGMQFERPKW